MARMGGRSAAAAAWQVESELCSVPDHRVLVVPASAVLRGATAAFQTAGSGRLLPPSSSSDSPASIPGRRGEGV